LAAFLGQEGAVVEIDVVRVRERWPLPNVWLGVSVEDQARSEERIPVLLDTPAAVRWVSAEPLRSEIKFFDVGQTDRSGTQKATRFPVDSLRGEGWVNAGLDWVVVGGESGPGARPMHADWARQIRDDCATAGVPFFFKQMARKAAIPVDLQVRAFPDAR
jgi:protein gp37